MNSFAWAAGLRLNYQAFLSIQVLAAPLPCLLKSFTLTDRVGSEANALMDFVITPLAIKRFIYLMLTAYVAFTAYLFSASHESYWLVWTALFLSLITVGSNFTNRLASVFATGCLLVVTVFIMSVVDDHFWLVIDVVFCLVLLIGLLRSYYPQYFYLFFLITLFMLLAVNSPATLSIALDRATFIVAGVVIAAFFQSIFLIQYNQDRVRALLATALFHLQKLNKEIFNCFLSPEYPDNLYLFERRIHVQKSLYLQSLCRTTRIVMLLRKDNSADAKPLRLFLTKLDNLFAIVLDIGLIRRRVTDHTVFDVCRDELTTVMQQLSQVFSAAIRQFISDKNYRAIDFQPLTLVLVRLEETYLNVLQVTAREPLVFLLFLNSLKNFQNELMNFCEDIPNIKKQIL